MAEYKLAELAGTAGVSARTIRYYLAEGVLPPPLGSGKNSHYDDRHLESLQKIKALQDEGYSLKQIRDGVQPAIPAPSGQYWETFPISSEVGLLFFRPLPPSEREWWVREIRAPKDRAAALNTRKDEEEKTDGN